MQPTPGRGNDNHKSLKQEIFVAVSLIIFCLLWMPLAIEKYPNNEICAALNILAISLLCCVVGSLFFLMSICCDIEGYQKSAPLLLIFAMMFGLIGNFMYDNRFCKLYFLNNYSMCFLAEFLSWLIYILSNYYLISMILERINYNIFTFRELQHVNTCFEAKNRIKILLIVNISMILIILMDIKIYSYNLSLNNTNINNMDILWVIFCLLLGCISVFMSSLIMINKKCVNYISHKCVLSIIFILTICSFIIGCITVWSYRISDLDGLAEMGNVFIWCIVNIWMIVEFVSDDLSQLANVYDSVAQTDDTDVIDVLL